MFLFENDYKKANKILEPMLTGFFAVLELHLTSSTNSLFLTGLPSNFCSEILLSKEKEVEYSHELGKATGKLVKP